MYQQPIRRTWQGIFNGELSYVQLETLELATYITTYAKHGYTCTTIMQIGLSNSHGVA